MLNHDLYPPQTVANLIRKGRKLLVSGTEQILNELPPGNWIGGTIPYFMASKGGVLSEEDLFVTDLTDFGISFRIEQYDNENITSLTAHSFHNGATFLILPFGKPVTFEFATHALSIPNILRNPVVGFVAGTRIEHIARQDAQVYFGPTVSKTAVGAVALHMELPSDKVARVEIINIFEQDPASDEIRFPSNSFVQTDCLINGIPDNISDYLQRTNYDPRLPLISNCGGALINRDRRPIEPNLREVHFYAPVFQNNIYKKALPVADYHQRFLTKTPHEAADNVIFSCNCLSNYLYGKLEGCQLALRGPMTYGEVAYQLLTQTQVYLVLDTVHP